MVRTVVFSFFLCCIIYERFFVQNFVLRVVDYILSSWIEEDQRSACPQVYHFDAHTGAVYNTTKNKSIYYDGNDLVIDILFLDRTACAKFLNNLTQFVALPTYALAHIFQAVFPKMFVQGYPMAILEEHYKSAESDSLDCSLAITVFTHLSDVAEICLPEELVMIENPRIRSFVGLKGYRCHLKSQTTYPLTKDNPNNVLIMSWEMYQRFDRLYQSSIVWCHRLRLNLRVVGKNLIM